jgi:type IV secretory pathway TrbF-like protein
MFGRESHFKESSPAVNTPEGIKASKVYADLVAGLQAENAHLRATNRRTWLVSAVLAGGFVGLALTRKRIPYFLEVDGSTGRVSASNRVAEEFKPKEANITYFIRKWVYWVILMNASTKDNQVKAITWTRGAATNELDDWVLNIDKTQARMATTAGLSREIVGLPTVAYNESGKVAFVDVTWIERINGLETRRQRKLLTIEFGLLDGDLTNDPLGENPIGFVITHFTISDQITR